MKASPIVNIKNFHLTVVNHHATAPLSACLSTTQDPDGFPGIGNLWPEQGGVVAGYMPSQEGARAYYLIVPINDAAESEKLTWGGYGTDSKATSDWDGLANTQALADSADEHPAAEFCRNVKIGNFNDFYLPARREASLITATVPHLFKPGWHWTSTQYSANGAFVQYFSDGRQDSHHKGNAYRVRAVRRFLIN